MKLLIVRHGEIDGNLNNMLIGRTDAPLNHRGIMQAEKIAERLKNEKVDAIFSSNMRRTRQTADIINKYHGLKITESKELREIDFGELEGKGVEDLHKARKESGLELQHYKAPGGENMVEVLERARRFIESIKKKHNNDTVLIVTHGVLIMELLLHMGNMSRSEREKVRHKNIGLSIVEVKDNEHEIKLINCTKHLDEFH